MDKEAEILKEKTLRDKRSDKLTVISLILLGVGIASAISFQSEHPLVALVLVPLIIGSTTGFIFSIFSVRLHYETSKKLIEIQSTLDEMKNKSKNLDE